MNFRKKRILFLLIMTVSLSLLFVACNETSYEGSQNIAEAKEVKEVYQGNLKENIVIDARGDEAYNKGHLKNAISMHPSELTVSDPVKATIAPKEQVEKVLSNKGITPDTNIYIYDDKGGVYASRIWWTLKVYGHENVKVINNGSKALEKLGLEMSAKAPEIQKSDYKVSEVNKDMIATKDMVKEVIDSENEDEFILDVRSLPEYEEGFIPQSIFHPHTKNYYSDNTFKSARDTYLFYKDLGIEKDDLVIPYCKSSYRATVTALVLKEAGYENVKVYDGAWLEWSQEEKASEVKEDAPITNQDGS
ncbi:MAG: sulfurtransferase [Bacillota bacterium]